MEIGMCVCGFGVQGGVQFSSVIFDDTGVQKGDAGGGMLRV